MEVPAIKGASKIPEVQGVVVVPIREAVAPGMSTPVQSLVHIAHAIAFNKLSMMGRGFGVIYLCISPVVLLQSGLYLPATGSGFLLLFCFCCCAC